MSISLNYKLAAFLIVLGALSGIVCLLAYYFRDIGTKGKLSRRIPRWAKELIMSLSGQAMAISVILLGGMNLTPLYLVYISWFVWIISFLKFCFLLPDFVQRGPKTHKFSWQIPRRNICQSVLNKSKMDRNTGMYLFSTIMNVHRGNLDP